MSSSLPQSKQTPRPGGSVVFWLLVAMGFATFAPCIVLPEWREYQALRTVEQREQFRLDQVLQEIADEQRRLDALSSDPAAVARLARREFSFHRPGEQVIPVAVAPVSQSPPEFVPEPVDPPEPILRWARHLPRLNYDAVFCDEGTRPFVIGMSLGLILAAFILFSGRKSSMTLTQISRRPTL